MSMSNDTPIHLGTAKAFSVIEEAPGPCAGGDAPRPGGLVGAPSSVSDFAASDEFAHFLRHATRLEREGERLGTLRAWLDLAEAWRITQALRTCKGNRSAAARMLGIGRRTLYSKMDKLEISPTWSV